MDQWLKQLKSGLTNSIPITSLSSLALRIGVTKTINYTFLSRIRELKLKNMVLRSFPTKEGMAI